MTIEIATLKTAEIVALYNSHGGVKPVKKFADRATAEARLAKLIADEHLEIGSVTAPDAETQYFLTDAVDPEEDAVPEADEPKTAGKRGPAPEYADSVKLTKWVANPKKAGSASYARYGMYAGSKTVGEFLAAGGTRADLRWEIEHGHVEIK